MSSEQEVRDALAVLAFGYVGEGLPTPSSFSAAMDSDEGQTALREKVTLLHCTTQYPAPYDGVNLRAINTLREEFQVRVGYSDHTLGIEVPIAAVGLGAKVIEKHFTLDRKLKGPDHAASIEPVELKEMVKSIRNIEKALGDGEKKPSNSEEKNKSIVRKSIVALTAIKKGEIFSEKNIAVKRPGNGISPMQWDNIIGNSSPKDFMEDDLIVL